jgi:excisionase family DNA binding protein
MQTAKRPVNAVLPGDRSPGGPLLKTKEAAEYLRISPRQVQYLSGRGELPCIRMGKSTRYTTTDLEEFVSRHRIRGGRV